MNPYFSAAIMLSVLLGGAMAGTFVRPRLADRHLSRETMDVLQSVTTMLVTLAALILGLLTNSVKTSLDGLANDVRSLGVGIMQLDQTLQEYGPDADAVRQDLRAAAMAMETAWRAPPSNVSQSSLTVEATDFVPATPLSKLGAGLANLSPPDPAHRALGDLAQSRFRSLLQRSWRMVETPRDSISVPFFAVLAFWLFLVFAFLGLSAPRNRFVAVALALAAISVASVVFVIVDLDTPFDGIFAASDAPLRDAIAFLAQQKR